MSRFRALPARPRAAAFTLVEIMISTAVAGVIGGIIYLVAVESLTSYARNVSINRSYTGARLTLDRIAQTVGSAGHTPVLLDTNGAITAVTPAAGIRFYRANPNSNFKVTVGATGPSSVNKSITIQLGTGQTPPLVKDLITVPTLGYQGTVSSITTVGTTSAITCVNTIAADCSPAPTSVVDFTNPQLYVQSYTQVAYIVVGNQLRYYPQAKSVAVDGTTVFNSTANYQVLVNLVSAAFSSAGTAAAPLLPFSIINTPTIQVQLYAENPDYNNRATVSSEAWVGTTNTYTFMQCSLAARSPVLLRSPY